MKIAKVLGLVVFVSLGLLLFVGCNVWRGYNRAVTMDEQVKTAWAQVENQLQRRYDLIPNLVETVKGVAGQEQEVFLGIAKSREAYFQAKSVDEKARAASGLEGALSRLLVLQERYPELRSNESFLRLQDSLEGTENRLSVERMRYNDAVRAVNTFTRTFPGTFYASIAGVEQAEYFEPPAEARETPRVDFSGG